MSTLLKQSDLVELELDQRLERARTSETQVPGFGSLSKLEQEQARIASELAKAKEDVATRQRALERAILQHETLKESIETGDAMHADFSAMLATGIDEFLEANVSKTPESANRVLRGLNEMAPRQLFVERWPNVKKSIEKKIKELDRSIKSMMSDSEKGKE